MLFDIMEEGEIEGDMIIHAPIAPPKSLKPVNVPDLACQMCILFNQFFFRILLIQFFFLNLR